MAVCAKCQTRLAAGAKFCPGCGFMVVFAEARMDKDAPPDSTSPALAHDEKICESCGAAIKKAAEICRMCGVLQKTPEAAPVGQKVQWLGILALVLAGASSVVGIVGWISPMILAPIWGLFVVAVRCGGIVLAVCSLRCGRNAPAMVAGIVAGVFPVVLQGWEVIGSML